MPATPSKTFTQNFFWALGIIALIFGLLFWSISHNVNQITQRLDLGHGHKQVFEDTGSVAVIYIEDVIFDSEDTLEALNAASEDDQIKAVVIRISSPGGAVAPSQEIYQAIAELDKSKPVVCSMGDLAASGGFYVAMGCRTVFANPGTLTGSIGVIMQFMNMEKLYTWAQLRPYILKAGKNKDLGSPLRDMTAEEKTLLQELLDLTHGQFKQAIAKSRGDRLKTETLNEFADGRILLGEQAQKLGFIDQIGSEQDALAEAKKIAKLPSDATITRQRRGREGLPGFFGSQIQGNFSLESLIQQAPQVLQWVSQGGAQTSAKFKTATPMKSGVPYYLSPMHSR